MKRYFTMAEVCEAFNVTPTTIRRWYDPITGCGFPQPVPLGPVGVVSLHDKRTRHFMRTKSRNCRIGFPVEEVDAWDLARRKTRQPSSEGPTLSDGKAL